MYIKHGKFPKVEQLFRYFIAWIFIPCVVYILSYAQFWLQGHTIGQFVELHKQIWYYQTHLVATHPYQSTPLQWVFDVRPVWLSVDYSIPGKIGNIYNTGNPVIFIVGLVALLCLFAECIHRFEWNKLFLTICYVSVWGLWLFSPRIMFFYHYAPAVPFLCIALAAVLHRWLEMKKKRYHLGAYGVLGLAMVWFVVFYPNLTGLPVPAEFANKVYFAIPSWK
jgi:dolichyl-phosphate-mannose--protein O-mannosyl transferase